MAAGAGLPLHDDHLVAAGGGDAGVLQTGRAAPDDKRLLGVGHRGEAALAPLALAAHHGVVDALDAPAGDDAPPAVVDGHATADVVLAPVADLLHPVLVGEELTRQQDGVSLAGLEDLFGDPGVGDAPHEQDRRVRDLFDSLGVAALPAGLVGHRGVDERVVDACGDVHVVHVGALVEIGHDPLHVVHLQVAGPERGGVDAVAHDLVVTGGGPDAGEGLQ